MGYPDPAMATTPFLLPGPVSKPQQDWHLTSPVFLCLCCVDEQPIFLLESSCRTNWPFDIFRLLWLLGQTHRKLCFKVYFNSLTVFWRKCHHLWNRTLHPSSLFFHFWKTISFLEIILEKILHVFPWKTLKKATSSCCFLRALASLPRRRPAAALRHLSSAPTTEVDPGFTPGLPKNYNHFKVMSWWFHGI